MELGTQTHLTALRDLLGYRQHELRTLVHAAQLARGPERDPDAGEARDRAELAQVDAALHRLEAGSYGDCLQCGEPIPLQRLLVQPAAERCAACQSVTEGALRR